jgi:TP901 family phage tail tape measure protein
MATKPIVIGIQGDTSRLKKALGEAEKGIKGFSKRVGKMGAKAGLAFGAAATAVGVTGVQAAADFEKSMREVLTLLPNAGAETFGQLSDQVKTFSKEFGVLPNEVIPSLYQALSAGVPQDNVFEFLEVAQMAAKGGVTDLETAVDGITSVVNAYGSDVLSAAQASDMMFTAVRLGKTDFTQLSNSMFQVAPIASALGVDFQDVTGALANLTAQGTPTKVAATQMKAALSELGKEGTKADIAFREIAGVGFTDFIAAGGNTADAFILLSEGAAASNQSVLDMFGSIEAGQAVLGLTSDGGEAFNATLGEMENSAGATETAFDTMDQGLAANFDRIKANIEVLKIEIGQKLAPLVRQRPLGSSTTLTTSKILLKTFERRLSRLQRKHSQSWWGLSKKLLTFSRNNSCQSSKELGRS